MAHPNVKFKTSIKTDSLTAALVRMAEQFRKLDLTKSAYLAGLGFENMGRAFHNKPLKPRKKIYFEGTAREYRAAKRKLAREMRQWKRRQVR